MIFELYPYTKFEVKRTNGVEMAGLQSGGRIIIIIIIINIAAKQQLPGFEPT